MEPRTHQPRTPAGTTNPSKPPAAHPPTADQQQFATPSNFWKQCRSTSHAASRAGPHLPAAGKSRCADEVGEGQPDSFAAHREVSHLRSRMHSRARRRPARAGAAQAPYTSDSDTDISQKSKFNNSNYLLRICRSSAPAFRATPATMQFIIHNDAKLSKLTPAQPLTANRSGGFSSRETHRTQPALKTTNPARPRARGRPQRGGEAPADKTPAPAGDWQPTPNRCKRPWGIGPG